MNRERIRMAYEYACEQETEALKPGNVHRFADGHGMAVTDFLTSAADLVRVRSRTPPCLSVSVSLRQFVQRVPQLA